jgi:hypothetical protein
MEIYAVTVSFSGLFTFKELSPEQKEKAQKIIEENRKLYNNSLSARSYGHTNANFYKKENEDTFHIDTVYLVDRYFHEAGRRYIWQSNVPKLDKKICSALDKENIPYSHAPIKLSKYEHHGDIEDYLGNIKNRLRRFWKGVSGVQPIPLSDAIRQTASTQETTQG